MDCDVSGSSWGRFASPVTCARGPRQAVVTPSAAAQRVPIHERALIRVDFMLDHGLWAPPRPASRSAVITREFLWAPRHLRTHLRLFWVPALRSLEQGIPPGCRRAAGKGTRSGQCLFSSRQRETRRRRIMRVSVCGGGTQGGVELRIAAWLKSLTNNRREPSNGMGEPLERGSTLRLR